MAKTLDDFIAECDLRGAPAAVREVYAIREKIREEREGMTREERREAVRRGAEAFLSRELPPKADSDAL